MTMADLQRVIFESPILRIGLFRCFPWYPNFADTGPISGYLIVFPRTSVGITHADGRPIVADPNVVMFYNKDQLYTRHKLSERGDLCEWFAFDPEVIGDVVRQYDAQVEDRLDRPFALSHGPSDSHLYLLQRLVVDHILAGGPFDLLAVEEIMVYVLGQAVGNAYCASGMAPGNTAPGQAQPAAELSRAIKVLLGTNFRERLSLDQIARAVAVSPYHLCRIFRKQTGSTIHSYLNQIRLRTALEYVAQGDTDLTTLALDLGFSSHSHFTKAFREAFGMAPSRWRRIASVERMHELSKIMIV